MTTNDKKQLYWDISQLQAMGVLPEILPKFPPLLPVVRQEELGVHTYFIDETRLPKELFAECRELVFLMTMDEPLSQEEIQSTPIGINMDLLPEFIIAPIIEK